MSEIKELQEDEREALNSIYEGDNCFKQVNPTSYQYKYGEDDNIKSFLVELVWGENYPNDLPTINMDTFYNRNLITPVKEKIVTALQEEGNQWLGCGMTYTLFEYLKDHIDELIAGQPDALVPATVSTAPANLPTTIKALTISTATADEPQKPAKKEQLTKAQKRRQWERTDHKGEKERGWNWVDIVKHLSQTGAGKEKGNSDVLSGTSSNTVLVS